MGRIEQYINDLAGDALPEVRTNAIHQLQFIEERDLPRLVQPLSKGHWEGAAEVVIQIGYPRVKSILPELLVWVQDGNWPGAFEIAGFLARIGGPMVPEIKRVLTEQALDQEWVYWILKGIVSKWPTELVELIKEELFLLAHTLFNDLDLEVIQLLIKHRFITLEQTTVLLRQKEKDALQEMEQLLNENANVDCEELNRIFWVRLQETNQDRNPEHPNDVKEFYEANRSQFSFCNQKERLGKYIQEIRTSLEELLAAE